MHHQEYLLKKNDKTLSSKWQEARQLIETVADTLSETKEANLLSALRLAEQALLKIQVEEENPPLKKFALDAMNGKPVWVVSDDHDGRWGIVNTSDQSVVFFVNGGIEKEAWFDGRYIFRHKKEILDHTKLLEKYNIIDGDKRP